MYQDVLSSIMLDKEMLNQQVNENVISFSQPRILKNPMVAILLKFFFVFKCNYICIHENELRSELRDKRNKIDVLLNNVNKIINSDFYTITQGNKGAINYHKNKIVHCPAFATNVVDRIGSGDILFALSSIALASKLPIDFSLFFSSIGAANSVSKIGTGSVISKKDLIETINELVKSI